MIVIISPWLVDYTLTEKFKADDLRMLYKMCFEVTGKVSIALPNMFNGASCIVHTHTHTHTCINKFYWLIL